MINGFEYGWEDIQIGLGGKVVIGATEITYSGKKEHTNIYGRGDTPVAMGRGRRSYDGAKIVVLQSEFEALCESAPGGDPTKLKPFEVVVAYAPEDGARIKTDLLQMCRITEWKKGGKEGDANMPVELPFLPGKIRLNV